MLLQLGNLAVTTVLGCLAVVTIHRAANAAKGAVDDACQPQGKRTADALALEGRDERPADLGALGLLPKSSSSSSSPGSSADASSDSSTAGIATFLLLRSQQ